VWLFCWTVFDTRGRQKKKKEDGKASSRVSEAGKKGFYILLFYFVSWWLYFLHVLYVIIGFHDCHGLGVKSCKVDVSFLFFV